MKLILAVDNRGGLAKNGKIPWKNKEEMKFFTKMTTGKTVVMGRKTHESIGHDLKDRVNLVVRQGNYQEVLKQITKLEAAGTEVWCIGGTKLARAFLDDGMITDVYLSVLNEDYNCDLQSPFVLLQTGLPECPLEICYFNSLDGFRYWHTSVFQVGDGFTVYRAFAPNRDENNFKALVRNICQNGDRREDRTGMGTRSLFGEQLKFKLYRGNEIILPVSTLRTSFNRGIFEELMWFIRGQTDSKILEEKKVNIWKKNSQKEVLKSLELEYPEGDCGPVYGFQWRHWGAKYPSTHLTQGSPDEPLQFDQLSMLIKTIKECPLSRRLVLSAWNVADLDKMVLPPCHVLYQFDVSSDGRLSCHMYQRSSDIILAGMWNVTSAALLTILIGKVTGHPPGTLTVSYGNVHVYNNHSQEKIDHLLHREPFPFPTLILPEKTIITDYTWEDLKLMDYQSHSALDFEMNV